MARYRIESLLVMGRRGPVYRAVDEDTARDVILRTFAESAALRQRALRGVAGAADLFETGRMKGKPYAVVELLAGPHLDLARADAEASLAALLATVAAAHAEGIVHGRLHSRNVHDVPGRGLVIADFGLPDVPGPAALPADDVYALGVLAYMLLARRAPLRAEDEGLLPPPGPSVLANLVLHMLDEDPRGRPTADEALRTIRPRISDR